MTTAREIITRAFSLLQYYGEGESPSAQAMADGLAALNSMMASWHNDGLLVFYPPSSNWLGDWKKNYAYNVNDGVCVGGNTYTCAVVNTSTANDEPGRSPNWADYWTLYAETPMTLASTFPLGPAHERGVQALLCMDLAPLFNVPISPRIEQMANDGMNGIYGQYFKVPEASSDPGITRMPSQIWPYSVASVSG
jgi:hypothetical protein